MLISLSTAFFDAGKIIIIDADAQGRDSNLMYGTTY